MGLPSIGRKCEPLSQFFRELPCCRFDGSCVVDHERGAPPLLIKRQLALLPRLQFFKRPSPRCRPGRPLFERCIDERHRVTDLVPAALQKDRRVEEDHVDLPGGAGLAKLGLQIGPDPRMDDPFEVAAIPLMFRRWPEDLPRKCLSMHLSIGPEDPLSEPLDEPPADFCVHKSPMTGLIGVQRQDPPMPGQGPRYGALPRGDPADKADHGNGRRGR